MVVSGMFKVHSGLGRIYILVDKLVYWELDC